MVPCGVFEPGGITVLHPTPVRGRRQPQAPAHQPVDDDQQDAIAAHARIRDRVRDAEAAYRDLFDNIPDLVVSADAAGAIHDCNPVAATTLGVARAELRGRPVHTLYHPSCQTRARREYDALASASMPRETELRMQGPDGAPFDVEAHLNVVRDHAGRVIGSRSILRDITPRLRVEAALRASRARYESLYADAPDMFASVDIDTGRIVQCNRTLVRVTGQPRIALMGRELRDLHETACWPILAAAVERLQVDDQVRDVELRIRGADGAPLDVSLSMAAIRDEEDNLYYRCTWRDITVRRRTQEALHLKQRELHRSRKELQALTARLMTAQEDERRRISHELHDDVNQRLALLTLEIETLERDLPNTVDDTTTRLRALREQVVALSDDVHGLAYQFHPSILDDLGLSAALEALTDEFRRREGIEIEVTRSVPDKIAAESAYCLYRVTQESLRNIAAHARSPRVAVALRSVDGGLSLVIEDFGVGFEPGGADGDRPGLGVVGMQERVRLAGGRFRLASRVGQGTRIDVWVPTLTEGP